MNRVITAFAFTFAALFAGFSVTPDRSDGCDKFVCPTVAPVQSYQAAPVQTYQTATAYQTTAYQKVVVPQVYQVPVRADYYYSANDSYRDQLLVDAIVGRLATQNQQASNASVLEQELQKYARITALLQSQGKGQPVPIEQFKAEPEDGIDPKFKETVSARCLRCHTEGKADGGLSLDDLGGVNETVRLKMYALVSSGMMPKGQARIEDANVVGLFYDFAIPGE